VVGAQVVWVASEGVPERVRGVGLASGPGVRLLRVLLRAAGSVEAQVARVLPVQAVVAAQGQGEYRWPGRERAVVRVVRTTSTDVRPTWSRRTTSSATGARSRPR
jgi:hypothetical protein